MVVKLNFRANVELGTMSFIVSFNKYDTVMDILADSGYFRGCLGRLRTEMGLPGYYYFSGIEDLDHTGGPLDEEDIIRNY